MLGSAICAAYAAGLFPTLGEAAGSMVSEESRIQPRGTADQYKRNYRTYLRLYEATKPLL